MEYVIYFQHWYILCIFSEVTHWKGMAILGTPATFGSYLNLLQCYILLQVQAFHPSEQKRPLYRHCWIPHDVSLHWDSAWKIQEQQVYIQHIMQNTMYICRLIYHFYIYGTSVYIIYGLSQIYTCIYLLVTIWSEFHFLHTPPYTNPSPPFLWSMHRRYKIHLII